MPEKDYHDSYYIACSSFIEGKRCSYCSGKKVNVRDSLGYIYPNSFNYWSDKNNKTPYDYTYGSGKQGYWKCNNNKHEDFLRSIHSSVIRDFRCPYCQYSKGEKRIEEILFQKDFIKITQEDYNKLNIKDKLNYLYFIPQKSLINLLDLKMVIYLMIFIYLITIYLLSFKDSFMIMIMGMEQNIWN